MGDQGVPRGTAGCHGLPQETLAVREEPCGGHKEPRGAKGDRGGLRRVLRGLGNHRRLWGAEQGHGALEGPRVTVDGHGCPRGLRGASEGHGWLPGAAAWGATGILVFRTSIVFIEY
jgi:hypothetical protein